MTDTKSQLADALQTITDQRLEITALYARIAEFRAALDSARDLGTKLSLELAKAQRIGKAE